MSFQTGGRVGPHLSAVTCAASDARPPLLRGRRGRPRAGGGSATAAALRLGAPGAVGPGAGASHRRASGARATTLRHRRRHRRSGGVYRRSHLRHRRPPRPRHRPAAAPSAVARDRRDGGLPEGGAIAARAWAPSGRPRRPRL